MRAGFAFLVVAYVLSQFYRSFLAVLSPDLARELGATPAQLSDAQGLWFLVFAAAQIPVGWLLDRVGPRRTAPVMLGLGGAGGAALIATAQSAAAISWGMMLIGLGCAPVLMAGFFIFSRSYPPAVFATLAGALVGAGTLGNIASSVPLAWAAEAVGWRAALWGLAGLTLAVAAGLYATVRDPAAAGATDGADAGGGVLSILATPALWLIFPLMFVNYAPSINLRGLWSGPYLERVFGADATLIGWVTLAMGLAMVAANFIFPPLDARLGTRKWVALGCLALGAVGMWGLAGAVSGPLWLVIGLMVITGLSAGAFPVIMAHGRSFIPARLAGRGVTLLNLFGIGGAGVLQMASSALFRSGEAAGLADAQNFARLFAFYGLCITAGLAAYLFSRDRTD